MKGALITFEGTEGSGKSTHIQLLAERLRESGKTVRTLREPGGTAIGEEIRHTLKHSHQNQAMMAEAELLLMNASRAQLVREVIRPALATGEVVLCDRYYDSTVAYQGHGRQLNLEIVRTIIEFAIEGVRPHLTFLLSVPVEVSEVRRIERQQAGLLVEPSPHPGDPTKRNEPMRDRMEEADRAFFERVDQGYQAIAAAEPRRVCLIDATQPLESVRTAIWKRVDSLLSDFAATSHEVNHGNR